MDSSLQDCYYYYYSSCNKGSSCPFRHCEAALGNEDVCEEWKTSSCFDTECSFRHMNIEKKRSHIACYWESQAGGCRKPHCVFSHSRPRDEGGTILSEEEKIAAITSPPPQMAMPMADGPSPHELYYDNLPQDNITSNVDSPAVERVVINPFEEETDEESIHGTPVKSEKGQKVNQKKVPPRNSRQQIPLTKESEKEKSSELDFAVKSLDEIRQEKLERAKKLIEEADRLLSQEAPEIKEKTEAVLHKIDNLDKDQPEESKSTKSTSSKTIKVNAKSSSGDLPEVKSYEEILREKALASMMAAKARKLKAQEEQEKKSAEEKQKFLKQEMTKRSSRSHEEKTIELSRMGRRVVVRRRSDSPSKAEEETSSMKTNIRSRLGPRAVENRIHDRLGVDKKNDQHSDSDGTDNPVQRKRKQQASRPSIKSRLGIGSNPKNCDNDSNDRKDRKDKQPRERNKMETNHPKDSVTQSVDLGITMSDFSSDGMDEESSEDERSKETVKKLKRDIPTRTEVDKPTRTEVDNDRLRKANHRKEDTGDDLLQIKVKSLDEILREKAMRTHQVQVKVSKPTGIKRKIVINESEKSDASPPKMSKAVKIPVKKSPPKIGRKIVIVKERSETESSNSDLTNESSESDASEEIQSKPNIVNKNIVQNIVMKPVLEVQRNTKVTRIKQKSETNKRDRKAPVQLYRPPALKNKATHLREEQKAVEDRILTKRKRRTEHEDADNKEQECASINQPVQKSKQWGVKTFSEILREKQMKRQQTVMKEKKAISPINLVSTVDHTIKPKRTKPIFSPIKFESSTDGKPNFQGVKANSDKLSVSPTLELTHELDSSTDVERKMVKRSNIWSSRCTNMKAVSEVSGARKLSVHKRLGTSVKTKESVRPIESMEEDLPSVPVKPLKAFAKSERTKTKSSAAEAEYIAVKVKSPTVKPTINLGQSSTNKGESLSSKEIKRRYSTASSTKSEKEVSLDENDESLNLNDTDLLEAELLELLGGSEGIKKAEKLSIEQQDEDDLLLEELLS